MSRRPTGEAAYRDSRHELAAIEPRIVAGSDIAGKHTIEVDACVIGSGAGGAPFAKELAEGGLRVAILEEGEWWQTDQFDARPSSMLGRLYRDGGQTVALGTPPIPLPLGRGIGGTTLVNSGTCFRTPPHVLAAWRRELGLEWELEPYFRRVERELNVSQVPASLAGQNALLVKQGTEALGWHGDFLYRNVRGCVGSGVCAYGCPAGAKQHTGLTYIPRAWAAGATTYTGARAQIVELGADRAVREVRARTSGGGMLRVRCRAAVLACGALLTPALLRRIGVRSPHLGRNLAIHPATAVRARFSQPVMQWDGVPQSYYVDEFADRGVMMEGIAGPPDHLAMTTPRSGAEHRELMLDAARTATFGVMVSDTTRGSVRGPLIRYSLNRTDVERFRFGIERLVEIFWAAGAHEVLLPVAGMAPLRGGDNGPLQRARIRPGALTLMAFHPLGSARAGAHPGASVVGPGLEVHGTRGLYVSDASAVPGALGVNPQITIMAMASQAAFGVLGRPAPIEEPEPEHIA